MSLRIRGHSSPSFELEDGSELFRNGDKDDRVRERPRDLGGAGSGVGEFIEEGSEDCGGVGLGSRGKGMFISM